jgi:hypothetical protein
LAAGTSPAARRRCAGAPAWYRAPLARPSSAALALESEHDRQHDPVWQAALNAPPALPDALSAEELAEVEESIADIRAGRVQTLGRAEVLATLERMRLRDEGE